MKSFSDKWVSSSNSSGLSAYERFTLGGLEPE